MHSGSPSRLLPASHVGLEVHADHADDEEFIARCRHGSAPVLRRSPRDRAGLALPKISCKCSNMRFTTHLRVGAFSDARKSSGLRTRSDRRATCLTGHHAAVRAAKRPLLERDVLFDRDALRVAVERDGCLVWFQTTPRCRTRTRKSTPLRCRKRLIATSRWGILDYDGRSLAEKLCFVTSRVRLPCQTTATRAHASMQPPGVTHDGQI